MRTLYCQRIIVVLSLITVLVGIPSTVSADWAWTIFRDTSGGALAGLVVGLAIDVARGEFGEATRWGFVSGTFLGLGFGIYQATRETQKTETQSLLDIHLNKEALAALEPPAIMAEQTASALAIPHSEVTYRVNLVDIHF